MLNAEGAVAPLEAAAVRHEAEALAARGLRVLALARKSRPAGTVALTHEDVGDGLVFLGLQGMLDPPRPEAGQAVRTCQQAGIRVKMITGDHAKTAAAIAQQLGFADVTGPDGRENVMTGQQLASLSDAELIDAAQRCHVFARVSPEQKLRLVKALQTQGHVVAMTGDGVNDAPALRRADIGVAMALSGTEVAREAADMILTDDNFASIEAAVEEGRGVFETLRKFIVWTLPTNGGQSLALLLAVVAGLPLPLQPVQLLWINMTTAIFLGLMLAFEPTEAGMMSRPPRDSRRPLLSGELLARIALVSVLLSAAAFGLFEWELALGATRRAGLDGGHRHVHRGPGVLPVELPLADAFDVVRRLVQQSLDLGRHRRHAGAAVGLHLPAVHERRLSLRPDRPGLLAPRAGCRG